MDQLVVGYFAPFTWQRWQYIRWVQGCLQVVANQPLFLSFAGKKGESAKPAAGGERKVTAGTMPDFSYSGKGVKIGEPSPDSPAAGAGLKKGDIIVKLGTHEITDLKTYAAALRSFDPGDVVPLEYIREGEHKTTEISLIAR